MTGLNTEILPDELTCDHLIIGSGAGASVAGLELARAGLDVVMLEEGDHHPTESFGARIGQQTSRLYRNGGLTPLLGKPSIAFAEGRCVGGTTVINGGLIWRTPDHVLEEWQQHHELPGSTPTGSIGTLRQSRKICTSLPPSSMQATATRTRSGCTTAHSNWDGIRLSYRGP